MLRKITNYFKGNSVDAPLEEIIVNKPEKTQDFQEPVAKVNVAAASETDTTEEETPLKLNRKTKNSTQSKSETNTVSSNETKVTSNNSNEVVAPILDELLTNVVDTVNAKKQAQEQEEAKKVEEAQKLEEAKKQAQLQEEAKKQAQQKEEVRQTLLQKQQREKQELDDDSKLATNMENPLRPIYEADKIVQQAQKDKKQQLLDRVEANYKKAEFGIESELTANNAAAEQKPAQKKSLFSQTMSNIISNLYLFYKSITDGVKKLLRIKNKSEPTIERVSLTDNDHVMDELKVGYINYQKNADSQTFIQAEKNKMLASKENIYATKKSINNYTEMYDPNLLILSQKPVVQPLTLGQKISNFFRNLFTTKATKAKNERIAERKVKSSEIMAKLLVNNAKRELFDVLAPEPVLLTSSASAQPRSTANAEGLRHRRPFGLGLFDQVSDSNFANPNDALFIDEEKAAPSSKIKFD